MWTGFKRLVCHQCSLAHRPVTRGAEATLDALWTVGETEQELGVGEAPRTLGHEVPTPGPVLDPLAIPCTVWILIRSKGLEPQRVQRSKRPGDACIGSWTVVTVRCPAGLGGSWPFLAALKWALISAASEKPMTCTSAPVASSLMKRGGRSLDTKWAVKGPVGSSRQPWAASTTDEGATPGSSSSRNVVFGSRVETSALAVYSRPSRHRARTSPAPAI
jgi:hypothetical protein